MQNNSNMYILNQAFVLSKLRIHAIFTHEMTFCGNFPCLTSSTHSAYGRWSVLWITHAPWGGAWPFGPIRGQTRG